jgi:hypothetical protein
MNMTIMTPFVDVIAFTYLRASPCLCSAVKEVSLFSPLEEQQEALLFLYVASLGKLLEEEVRAVVALGEVGEVGDATTADCFFKCV